MRGWGRGTVGQGADGGGREDRAEGWTGKKGDGQGRGENRGKFGRGTNRKNEGEGGLTHEKE